MTCFLQLKWILVIRLGVVCGGGEMFSPNVFFFASMFCLASHRLRANIIIMQWIVGEAQNLVHVWRLFESKKNTVCKCWIKHIFVHSVNSKSNHFQSSFNFLAPSHVSAPWLNQQDGDSRPQSLLAEDQSCCGFFVNEKKDPSQIRSENVDISCDVKSSGPPMMLLV